MFPLSYGALCTPKNVKVFIAPQKGVNEAIGVLNGPYRPIQNHLFETLLMEFDPVCVSGKRD